MTDLQFLYVHALARLLALYLSIYAWSRRCHCYNYDFWVLPLLSLLKQVFTYLIIFPHPFHLSFRLSPEDMH